MDYAFQDRENLYIVLEYLSGGDLRYHLIHKRKFDEKASKFMIACVILALEICHKNGYIHRDLKPENLVFDKEGYLKLTDFGVAKMWRPENHMDTSGTPGYMSPEVLCRKNHSYSVDFFALGIILHEFIMGYRPYRGANRKEIKDAILSKQAYVKKQIGWSDEAIDFCNQLMKRKVSERLGNLGIWELKNHPWMRDFKWNDLLKYNIKPTYIPQQGGKNFDYNHVNKKDDPFTIEEIKMLNDKKTQKLFDGFNFTYEGEKSKHRSEYMNNTITSTN